MSTMNVLICQQPKELVWKQREIPIPGDNEALIKIKSVGICGTDIHAWGGNQPFFSYPRVLGHEICGEIVRLGKNIADLKNGQQVAVIPYVACQQCPACKSGRTNCCEKISVIGVHQDGGFSEYLSVPVANILPADGIDPQAAALIEPFAISAHAVRRAAIAGRERHLLGEHVRRGTAVFTRHGQTVLQGITGNLQRTANIAGIQTPQHDRHQNVILCTFALLQHAVHPRQPERQQFAFFRGLQLF